MSMKYEIIVFNKETMPETRKLCAKMDPSMTYIQHILCQDHYERNGYRDLRKLGRPLTNVVAVETNVWSTCIQRPNVVEVSFDPKPDLE